jgi:LytS/YehU family sensor histidine kinase
MNISFYYFVITGSAATASFFSRYSLYKLKLQAEKEKLLIVKEINFLKTQFNSRLTFDFLKYCNRSIRPHSPETAESVSVFSDMLKYTLHTRPNEKVLLHDEIVYINSFIDIQKLLSSNVYVNFNCTGNNGGERIIPRILITFVENAFKHGVYNSPEFPIDIRLTIENKRLLFRVKNKVNPNKKAASSLTGLENVNQALALHYAGNYMLKNEEHEGFYTAALSIEKDF